MGFVLVGGLFNSPSLGAGISDVQRVISPGGIEAWLVEDHSVPLIAVDFSFYGGSSQDEPGKEGLSSFVADLLNEGAGDMPALLFQERLDDILMHLSFTSGLDWIRGTAKIWKPTLSKAEELLSSALMEPRFDKDAIDRVRASRINTLRENINKPSFIAYNLLREAQYREHVYGRGLLGTTSSLTSISAEEIKNYHRRIFAKDRLKISVAGSIDAKSLGPLLDRVFGELPQESDISPIANVSAITDFVVAKEADIPQATILMSLPWLAMDDPDFFASQILEWVFGRGMSSRLFREVREKRGLVYHVSASHQDEVHSQTVIATASTSNSKISHALLTMKEQFAMIAERGVTEDELEIAKTHLRAEPFLYMDTLDGLTNRLMSFQLSNVEIDYVKKWIDMINKVSLKDVARVASRLFSKNPGIVIVGKGTEEYKKN